MRKGYFLKLCETWVSIICIDRRPQLHDVGRGLVVEMILSSAADLAKPFAASVTLVLWSFKVICYPPRRRIRTDGETSNTGIFVGRDEIEKTLTEVGKIATAYALVEEWLGYLIWQLRSFETANRQSHKRQAKESLQLALREIRSKEMRWSLTRNLVQK
jgi:hypothetical protein